MNGKSIMTAAPHKLAKFEHGAITAPPFNDYPTNQYKVKSNHSPCMYVDYNLSLTNDTSLFNLHMF